MPEEKKGSLESLIAANNKLAEHLDKTGVMVGALRYSKAPLPKLARVIKKQIDTREANGTFGQLIAACDELKEDFRNYSINHDKLMIFLESVQRVHAASSNPEQREEVAKMISSLEKQEKKA